MEVVFMSIRKIDDSMRDSVAGGAVYPQGDDEMRPYEVIDDESGEVVARFGRLDDAEAYARFCHLSDNFLFWDELRELREGSH